VTVSGEAVRDVAEDSAAGEGLCHRRRCCYSCKQPDVKNRPALTVVYEPKP